MGTMRFEERKEGDVLIIILEGELMGGDYESAFMERIYQAIKDNTANVVLDMKKMKWMNTGGLGRVMAGLTTLRSEGGDLKLACVSDRVRSIIEIRKLDNVIEMYNSIEEAVASFER